MHSKYFSNQPFSYRKKRKRKKTHIALLFTLLGSFFIRCTSNCLVLSSFKSSGPSNSKTSPYEEPSTIPSLRFNLIPSLRFAACSAAPRTIASSASRCLSSSFLPRNSWSLACYKGKISFFLFSDSLTVNHESSDINFKS